MALSDWPVGKSIEAIFLIYGRYRRAQFTVSRAAPGQVVLSHVRQKAVEDMLDKPVGSVPPQFLLQFLP